MTNLWQRRSDVRQRSWRPARTGLIGTLAVLVSAGAYAGTPVTWSGGAGLWNDPTAWDLNLIPNNSGVTYDVILANLTDDVSLNLVATVDTVANSGTLRLLDTSSLSLAQPGGFDNSGQILLDDGGTAGLFGAVHNAGFIWVESGTMQLNHDLSNSATIWLGDGSLAGGVAGLDLLSDVTLSGTGELYFYSRAAGGNEPFIHTATGTTLTNAVDHRIHGGSGRIGGPGRFVNNGLVDADTPLRTLTIESREFHNAGQLWARSGNLAVNVDDWHNEGTIRVLSGSQSAFSGTLFTNDASGVVESVGSASLTLSQHVTNFGRIATESGGTVAVAGSGRLVTNLPTGTFEANGGTIRFGSTNGVVQNLGSIAADEGVIQFAGGMDMFGGDLVLGNGSAGEITAGTTTFTRVRTTIDPASTLAVTDKGTGNATFTFNGILDNAGALISNSEAGGTTTFNLNGRLVDTGGTIRADGGSFNLSGVEIEESGNLGLEIRNGGNIAFSNVDSTAGQIGVAWTGTGGSLSFDRYRSEGPTTNLNLSGWTAAGGSLTLSGGSALEATGLGTLPTGTTLTVTGAGSRLSIPGLTETSVGSLVDLITSARLETPNLSVRGDLNLRSATFDGNLSLETTAGFSIVNGTNVITGNLSWVGDRTVTITGSSTRLNLGGALAIAPGSGLSLRGNSSRFSGAGGVTNSGLIEGAAPSNNQSTFFDLSLTNNADGVVRAVQNGTAAPTFFQFNNDITNAGLMEADGARLYFTGATVTNSGTLRALDHVDGSKLVFLAGTRVIDAGGITEIHGALGRLSVSAGANVELGTLTFAPGAGGSVSGAGSVVKTTNVVGIPDGSAFTASSSGRFVAPGLVLDGDLFVQTSAAIDAPITVNPIGHIIANSSTATLNGDVALLRGSPTEAAVLSLSVNSARVNGTGVVTNSGLIEGGGTTNNASTYFNLDLVNNADGIVRAFRNGTPTNTLFRFTGNITNHGLMEADGARLYFNGTSITNGGTLSATDAGVASKLEFLGGAQVVDAGGMTQISGADSRLAVSAGSRVELGTLSFTGGAGGFVTGAGSEIVATNDVGLGAGSTFTVSGSGRFEAVSLTLGGELIMQSSGVVNAPVLIEPTGLITASSQTGTINGDLTLQNGGANRGTIRISATSAHLAGTGVTHNSGLIEGGAHSNNGSTYVDRDLINNTDGIVRAYQNGTRTNTFLQLRGDVTNAGLMEGNGGNLYFPSTTVLNSGTMQAVNAASPSKLVFTNSTVVTDNGGQAIIDGASNWLEIKLAADVTFNALTLSNGGNVLVTDAASRLTINQPFTLGVDSELNAQLDSRVYGGQVTVESGGLLNLGHTQINNDVDVQGGGELLVRAGSRASSFNGALTLQSGALAQVLVNSARLAGSGLVTNNGLIQGGATSNNASSYLDLALINTPGGVVRAFQNGSPINTYFQMRGSINNAGTMEADGANLYFTGATVDNSGTLRAIDHPDGSKLIFLGSTQMTDLGGSTLVDGALSRIEVSGSANVELGTLTLSNGASGSLSGNGTVASATTALIPDGSAFSISSSGRFNASGLTLGGALTLRTSGIVDAPVTVTPTGQIIADSSSVALQQTVTLQNDGASQAGRISVIASNARVGGTGTIINSGVVEGGTATNNRTTRLDNDIVNNADGVIRAFSNGGATGNNFQLGGDITNRGLIEADGATLTLASLFLDNAGGSWSAINGGHLRVTSSFVGGSSGSSTVVDGDTSLLSLDTNSLVGFDFLNLTNGGDVSVSGLNSTLAILSPLSVGVGSVATVASNGRLQADGLSVGGVLAGQGGKVIGDVHLTATGRIDATSGVSTIDGNVTTTTAGSEINVVNSSTRLVVEGTINNTAGATLRVNNNTIAISGVGLLTNDGLLEGGAFSNNSTTTISKPLVNTGAVVATSINGATGTTLQLNGPTIANTGTMTASGANLLITGSTVDHAGTIRAVNDSIVTLQSSAVLNNLGGTAEVDGDASRLQFLTSSNAGLASLTLTNGGDLTVTGSTLDVASPFTAGLGSIVTINSSAALSGAGVQVDGTMNAGRSTITTPTTIGPTGTLNITSSSAATFNAPVTIETDGAGNDGGMFLMSSWVRIAGTGTVSNSGLIEAGASGNNASTYLDKDLTNNADGVVRSIQNAAATNTHLQLNRNVTNQGLMEADGANLYFTGASVTNGGTIRAVDHAGGSRLIFLNASQVSDIGGTAQVDGAASTLEVSGASNVAFNSVALTNGASGTVSGASSRLSGALTTGTGSTLSVTSNGALTVTGAITNNGTVTTSSGGSFTAQGPAANNAGGSLIFNTTAKPHFFSSLTSDGTLDIAATTLAIDGNLAFGSGAQLAATPGAAIELAGDFANASTLNTQFASAELMLSLDASFNAADPLNLEVGGADLGATVAGMIDNFGLSALRIVGADEFVSLTDNFNNDGLGAADALYVSDLTISDPDSRLVLNGLNVYYGVFNGILTQIDMSAGGSFTEVIGLSIAPEPTTALILTMGAWVLGRRRPSRRRQRVTW